MEFENIFYTESFFSLDKFLFKGVFRTLSKIRRFAKIGNG